MNHLGSNKEIVMILNDQFQEQKSSYPGHNS